MFVTINVRLNEINMFKPNITETLTPKQLTETTEPPPWNGQ